jgi:cation:H+ antiporter
MVISRSTVRKDIPFAIGATLLMMALTYDGTLSWVDGIILLAGFAAFMVYTLRQAKAGSSEEEATATNMKTGKAVLYLIGGLAGLVVGSNVFVDHASNLAFALGISEGVVGLTVVAGGTSLPELATSVVAARKGQSAIAIGNVIGSNVFNILMILGLTGVICPLEIEGITLVDQAVMLVSIVLVWLFSRTRYTVERWEGALLVGGYLVYLAWLITSL